MIPTLRLIRAKTQKHWVGLMLLLFSPGLAFAQTKTVTGTVQEVSGLPIPGASITIKNGDSGTISDSDGKFSLQASPGDVIVVSFIGYNTFETQVGERTAINVVLEEDMTTLDQVVVVGYGTQKKENVTGSVATIKGDNIANRSVTNVSSSLAGLASGVYVRQGSGRPGEDAATIRVRGTGTLSNADALVLVDGIVGVMDAVNPNDIESISVLKDAASAAIYGAQAANGVILITTKKGKKGKPTLSYSGTVSQSRPANMPDFVSDYPTHMRLFNESRANIGQPALYTDATIAQWETANADPNGLTAEGVPNYVAYPNTDWGTIIFENNTVQNHNLAVTGGSDHITYNVSGRYMDNPGIMYNTGLKRYEMRANVDVRINNFLSVGTQTFALTQDQDRGNVTNVLNFLRQTGPGLYPMYDGRFGGAAAPEENQLLNNLFGYLYGSQGKNKTSRFNTTLYAKWDILKGLSLENRVNYQLRQQELHSYGVPIDYWNFSNNTIVRPAGPLSGMTISQDFNKNVTRTFDNVLRYNNTFRSHDIGVMVGHNEWHYGYYSFGASKQGVLDANVTNISSATTMNSISGGETDRGMRSFFGRINYAFEGRYLFEANIRRDGSSRFGPNYRWGTFPSFSAGWRLSEESFMESLLPYVQSLKLRASWGKLGNDAAGDYDYQATYGPVNYSFANSEILGLRRGKMANPDLHWEETTVSEVGLEFGMLNNQLTAEVSYYNRLTDGILTQLPIPITSGTITAPTVNAAAVLNKGLEVALGYRAQAGEVAYSFGGNIAFNHNEVTKFKGKYKEGLNEDGVWENNLGDVSSGGRNRILEGYGINTYYLRGLYGGDGSYYNSDGTVNPNGGPKDGMIRTNEDLQWVNDMKAAGYTFSPQNNVGKAQLYYGDFIYADRNGDGIYGNNPDQYFTGTRSEPEVTYGITASVSWKGFDLSMIWAGAAGMDHYWNDEGYSNSTLRYGNGVGVRMANDHYYYNDADDADPANNINGYFPRLKYENDPVNNVANTFWLYKASFLKLRNLQIGYTVPGSVAQKIKASNMRIYFTGENLLTITKYPGLDPEMGAGVGYPVMRQYALGLNLNF